MKNALMTTLLQLLCVLSPVACLAQMQLHRGRIQDQHARIAPAASQQQEVLADQVVTALGGPYVVHPGQRRNHTKGFCALGTFIGKPEAAAYSRSALFSGEPVPVVARFS